MREPGLDRHEWESEWATFEPDLRESPRETLPAVGGLVERMAKERGIAIDDPVANGGGGDEIAVTLREAREAVIRVESSEDVDPGDVAAAVNLYREVYDHLLAEFRE